MSTAKERLKHFLTLADQGPAQRTKLAGELADFLVDWPDECPLTMREPVLTLLEMTLREADDDTRTCLAARLGGHSELPLELVNEFYLCAPRDVRKTILKRNESESVEAVAQGVSDPARLLAAARDEKSSSFTRAFAGALHVPLYTAAAILADESCEALAAVCKGAKLERALFSALALLKLSGAAVAAQLAAFDAVPQRAAENITAFWQSQNGFSSRAA